MKLTFTVPDLSYSANSISEFICMSNALRGSNFAGMGKSILTLYPELKENEVRLLSQRETSDYITNRLRFKFEEVKPLMLEKAAAYQACWDEHAPDIKTAYREIFGVSMDDSYDNMLCRVNMNPICPRFLEDRSFDIIYLYSDKGALFVAMHEIIHFVWFDVWQQQFHDSPALYEQPHVPWIFSELAIDAIMSDERLNKFIYNERQAKMPAYPEFYEMQTILGPLTEVFRELYKNNDLKNFMRSGFDFCKKNQEIFADYFG